MNRLEEHGVDCPYCGESITVVVDCSEPHQRYVEDCEVCCRPIVFDVTVDEGSVTVQATSEQD